VLENVTADYGVEARILEGDRGDIDAKVCERRLEVGSNVVDAGRTAEMTPQARLRREMQKPRGGCEQVRSLPEVEQQEAMALERSADGAERLKTAADPVADEAPQPRVATGTRDGPARKERRDRPEASVLDRRAQPSRDKPTRESLRRGVASWLRRGS
jgi:hypothetical protein